MNPNPFRLFKLKKLNYALSIQNYFCDMVMKSLPAGEVARFYENFKETLSDPTTTYPVSELHFERKNFNRNLMFYQNFPVLFLDRLHSPADITVLLSLIDACDSGGFVCELYPELTKYTYNRYISPHYIGLCMKAISSKLNCCWRMEPILN